MEVPIDRFLLPKELQAMLEQRVKTFNNMAQAQMKLTAWDSAMASIRQVKHRQSLLQLAFLVTILDCFAIDAKVSSNLIMIASFLFSFINYTMCNTHWKMAIK